MREINETSKKQFKIKRFYDTSAPIADNRHRWYLVNSHHNLEDIKCKNGRLEM